MTPRPIRLFGDSDSERIEQQLETVVRAWMDAWFSGVDVSVRSIAFVKECELGTGTLNLLGTGGRQATVSLEPLPLELFLGGGGPRGSSAARRRLEAELTKRAVKDLVERVIGPTEVSEPLPDGKAGYGCKVVVVIGQRVLPLSFSGACFHVSGARKSEPLHRIRPVLQKVRGPVEVRVVVGAARLSLAEVVQLTKGDVIALDARLDGPTRLEVADGSVAVRGVLGRQGGYRAIKMGEPQ